MKCEMEWISRITLVALFLIFQIPSMADERGGTILHVSSLKGLIRAIEDLEQDHVSGKAPYVVVAQGPIAKHFSRFKSVGGPKSQVRSLSTQGVSFEICSGSVLAGDLTEQDLLPQVRHLDQGAPRRIEELKESGFSYVKY